MVIAALLVFGALLAAWCLAPTERPPVSDSDARPAEGLSAPLAEGLPEAA
jgi:hypothetical protein